MYNKKSVQFLMLITVYICMFLLLVSCGGGGDSDSGSAAGNTGTIGLSTSESSLPADNTSSCIITATILDANGDPVRNYTDVTFTTTLGRFRNGSRSYQVQTQPPLGSDGLPDLDADPTGIVNVALIAGRTGGTATVTASSNGVTQSVSITIEEESVDDAASINLSATSATISADGVSSMVITATVKNKDGDGVSGKTITFSTGLGKFQNGGKSYSTTTGSSGIVEVSFIAGMVPGNTCVVASADDITQALSVTLTQTSPSLSAIAVAADPLRIAANGQSTSTVTATVTEISGAGTNANSTGTPIAGVPVTFYDASSTSTSDDLPTDNTWTGTSSSEFVTPGFQATGGIVTFTMTYVGAEETSFAVALWKIDEDPKSKTFLINTTGPVTEKSVSYTLDAGNYQFQVTADGEWEITVDGDISSITTTTSTVLAISVTDENGKASYAYTSTTTPGVVTIEVETGEISSSGEALSASVKITQTEGTPTRLEVTATPASVYANGKNEINITAGVYDESGQPVADGTAVTFSATAGTLKETSATTESGKAFTTLTAVSSATDVASTVTASSEGFSDSIVVTFLGVTLADMQATPSAIFANGTDTSEITVRLRNEDGAAVEGETISFETTGGTLTGSSAVTDSDGIATITLTAPTVVGSATITAYYGTTAISASTSISFEAIQDGSIVLTADPASIPADGTSTTVITATIKYISGAAVPKGTLVNFTTSRGTFADGSQDYTTITPDDTGVVNVSLKAAGSPGSAKVTVSAISISQTIYVGMGGAAISITLVANPTSIVAGGSSSSVITATIKDSSGAPVVQGTSVSFTTSLGTFSGGGKSITLPTPDASGTVSVSLISSIAAGTATVTASSSGVTQSITVTFTGGGGVVSSIVLAANPVSIPADGSSSSTVTATLRDSSGAAVPAGTRVTFATDLGTFSGGGTSITTTTPNATGTVSVSLISSTTAGSATVSATSGGVSQAVNVTFSGSGVVATINLTANPSTLSADGTSTSVIRADVRDASNNPAPDGTSISFVILTGTGTLFANTGTTVGGFVEVTYRASTTAGTETIRAMSDNFVSATVNITLTSAGVGSITLRANPSTLPADGTSSAAVTAAVADGSGNPIAKGTAVTFTTTLGTFTGGVTSITANTANATGTVTVSLISASTSGTATITALSGGVTQATTVTFAGGGQPASLSLATSQASVKSDNSDSATITATLLDGGNAPIFDYIVAFSADTGIISSSSATTDESGEAKVTFSSGTTDPINRTALITATAGTLTADIPVQILGSTLTLSTDKTTIPSDGSITATLTATAKNAGGTAVKGAEIIFSVTGTGGVDVTASSSTTNASGQLQATVKGTASGDVTVTAEWVDPTTSQVGTTASQAYTVGAATDTFRIEQPSTDPYSTRTSATYTGTVNFNAGSPATIVRSSGDFEADGFQAGNGIVVSGSASNDGIYTVDTVAGNALTLVTGDTLTAEGPTAGVTITSGVMVEVYAPSGITQVSFTTTIGQWDDSGSSIHTKTVSGTEVKAVLTSSLAGTATVQVYDADNFSTSDGTTIAFSVASGDVAQISLQASVYMVSPSVGGTENAATLTATVRTSGGQVVSGVLVSFSIETPTGGGEYIYPVAVITDDSGQAETTFTSGSLSTGAEGVTIWASVVNDPTITDSIAIVIGGTAGSVVIGRGTVIYDVNDATYRLPMAALVTDSNGNAVSDAVVTLSTWPTSYSSGVWYDQDEDVGSEEYVRYITGTFANEDVNENLILDPGEDTDGNGQLTPPNSSAGGVATPSDVVTDENGVAEFDLYYLKASAGWIVTRVRAQTVVVGTETTSSIELRLPAEETEAKEGLLPDSAYPIGLKTGVGTSVYYTFPTFLGTGDSFFPLSSLSAGASSVAGYNYTYDPTGGTPAVVGDWVWDYITVTNSVYGVGAYFPVRIIIVE